MPIRLLQKICKFYNPHQLTNAEKLVKVGLILAEIFGGNWDMPIFAVLSKKVQLLPSQSLGLLDRS